MIINLKTALLVFVVVSLSACGNSEMKQIKRDFMSGCQQSISKKVCSCAFDEWKTEYGEDSFIRLSKGEGMLISLDGKSRAEQQEDFLTNAFVAIEYCMSK